VGTESVDMGAQLYISFELTQFSAIETMHAHCHITTSAGYLLVNIIHFLKVQETIKMVF
jgi:hypothetical protein